ncbi:MAG: (2Fe-2S)-binding protein [Defluviicoccus sp.]|nr:MAG: (2Fe-2S)-binding protein [Defluviicoccus sp.]
MYVCVCNALNDREVKRLIASGRVRTADDIYAAFECTPQCGVCREEMNDMLDGGPCARAGHSCVPVTA